jgi:cystathionine gamma-synthase
VFEKFGIGIDYVDFASPESLREIAARGPVLVWLESPTNPMLKIVDIEAISAVGRKAGVPVLVDNTFASPFFQRPLVLGVTLSLSSTTKYVNGHSDCLGGVVVTNDAAWHEKMVFAQKAVGLNPSPFDCWLISPCACGSTTRTRSRSPGTSKPTRGSAGCDTPSSTRTLRWRWRGAR